MGYRIWTVQDLGIRSGYGPKISPGSGPAEAAQGLPSSMHPHPPTLTHLHMSTRLTLIHPDCHLLGKIHFNLRSVRRTAILHPRNQIWILAQTLAVLPFHTGESWPSVHDPTEPRGRRRSETLLSQWKSTHLAAPRTTSHATRRRPACTRKCSGPLSPHLSAGHVRSPAVEYLPGPTRFPSVVEYPFRPVFLALPCW